MAELIGITDSWTLVDFAHSHGTPKLAKLANKETGEMFNSIAFVKGNSVTFVGFSSKLGELSSAEISRRKDELQVVQLSSGNYKLCNKGEGNGAWEEIAL